MSIAYLIIWGHLESLVGTVTMVKCENKRGMRELGFCPRVLLWLRERNRGSEALLKAGVCKGNVTEQEKKWPVFSPRVI